MAIHAIEIWKLVRPILVTALAFLPAAECGSERSAEDLAREKDVARQVAVDEIRSRVEAAKGLASAGNKEGARRAFEVIREQIRRSPDPKALGSLDAECAAAIKEIQKKMEGAKENKAPLQQQEAVKAAEAGREAASDARLEEAQRLLERAQQAYDAGDYKACSQLCSEVMALHPGHPPANTLKLLALREDFQLRLERSNAAMQRAKEDLSLSIAEAQTVPKPGQILSYPSAEEWKRISERRLKYRRTQPQKPPEPWELEIEKSLEKPLSFEFMETPLEDVLEFMQERAGVNIILDRSAVRDARLPVTLKVQNMKVKSALEWVMKLTGLSYAFQNEAVFVSSPERLKNAIPELRVYDFEDLLNSRPDFRNRKSEVAQDWIDFLKKVLESGAEAAVEEGK